MGMLGNCKSIGEREAEKTMGPLGRCAGVLSKGTGPLANATHEHVHSDVGTGGMGVSMVDAETEAWACA